MPTNEEEWKKTLTPEQYRVLREKGTEQPFTGTLLHEKREGTYNCAACGNPLFASDTKFDSGTGWPSFDDALPGSTRLITDDTHGMKPARTNILSDGRTEVVCAKCGSHLGHLFDDGPTKTGKRYCMNSVCLELEAKEK